MSTVPTYMSAVLLTGHGDFDRLEYRTDVPVPQPQRDEVLIRVSAAGINNTDINLRTGWYSAHAGTPNAQAAAQRTAGADDSGW
jgi:NADPH:quinone reductase-like Zn-dependent oxidoreductase